MPEQNSSRRAEPSRDKSQDLVPPGREPVHQGQQFDEMQRQQKNPDGTAKDEDES